MPCWKKGLLVPGELIHSAKRGVIFQTTFVGREGQHKVTANEARGYALVREDGEEG
jgi:hypothetical protein